MNTWRADGRTLHVDTALVGMVDTPELARDVANAMNRDALVEHDLREENTRLLNALATRAGSPDAVRLLLDGEERDIADQTWCRWCRSRVRVGVIEHMSDCPLLVLLRKAGMR